MKPGVRDFSPDHIILHCGANDLSSERTASQIALTLKSEDNKISISLTEPRNDNLDNKANEVNCHLIHMCVERNIAYINHTNSIQPENLELNLDPYSNIENIRLKNSNRLIVVQLNINSLQNKFDSLVAILHNNVAILLVSEAKINSSFPTPQFKIEGYTTHRLGRN